MEAINTSSAPGSTSAAAAGVKNNSNEEFLNQKINFIQNHIEHLLQEITNLPAPWYFFFKNKFKVTFLMFIILKELWC